MNPLLTATEITALKAIRATYINDADLTELKAFFKKYGYNFSLDKNKNIEGTFKIITENFDSSRDLNGFTDAKIIKVYNIAKTMDLSAALTAIKAKAFQFNNDYSFESEKFVLNNDFDFTIYQTNDSVTVAKFLLINHIIGNERI